MRLQQLITGLVFSLISVSVMAGEARHYWGISNESYAFSEITGLTYKYGYDFSNTWGMEIQYGEATLGNSTLITDFKSYTSLLLRANQHYEKVTLFAVLGYAAADMTLNFASSENSYTGASYGIGMDLWGTKQTAITVAWMRHVAVDSTLDVVAQQVNAIDSVTLGITHHFDFAKSTPRY